MFSSSQVKSSKTLSEPLLQPDLDETEVSLDDEDCCYEYDGDDDEDYDVMGECDADTACDSVVAILVLPILLVIQFGLPYYSCLSQTNEQELPPLNMLAASIGLFALASILYKYSLRMGPNNAQDGDCRFVGSVLLALLPEVWANAVLATILVTHDTTISLQLLLVGNLFLAGGGVVRALGACRRLVTDVYEQQQSESDDDDCCKDGSTSDDDELDVSFYRGQERSICCCV